MPILLSLLFTLGAAAAAEKPNVVLALHNSVLVPKALEAFRAKFGPDACHCLITSEQELTARQIQSAHVLFLEHPHAETLGRLRATAVAASKRGLKIASDVPEIVQRAWGIEMPASLHQRLSPYWQNGGEENMLSFLLVLFREAGGPKNLEIPAPILAARQGVYHPDAPRLFPNLTEYLAWYRQARPRQGPLATVNFYNTYLKNRDTAFLDAQLRALESEGLAAAGVMGWPHYSLEKVFETPPNDPVKVMLAFTFSLSRPEDRAVLEKQNVHVINLMITEASYKDWAAGDRGVTPGRINSSVVTPESTGATDPILVATTETGGPGGLSRTMPIPERVHMAAKRAKRWITLRDKPNSDKKLAILYYNNPPGKGNIGASYLNIAPSIRAVLNRLREEGYNLGSGALPDSQHILDMLERVGRNVETWAPGELRKMVDEGGLILLSTARYREWFDKLPDQFRKSLNDRWGPPEKAELMTLRAEDGRRYFVIPGIRYGNVFLGPQLLRASFKEYTNVQHSTTLPPHHGYVAAYLYYRHQLGVDAVVHMGRHGTLEWLPGKGVGQAGWDCSEVILGDLPNAYYYIMDGDGEAIQARRRSAAVDISHLTPMLTPAGSQARFATLSDALAKWSQSRDASPLLAEQYATQAIDEAKRLDLIKQLNLDNAEPAIALPRIEQFLETAEESPIPLGLPTLGEMPTPDRQFAGLQAFLESAFRDADLKIVRSATPAWSQAIFHQSKPDIPAAWSQALRDKAARAIDDGHTWLRNVQDSPSRELAMLPLVLSGGFEPSGLAGDPLRSPASLPAGRNLHQGDPATWPTPAAWELGKTLATQLLHRHKTDHGKFPERISMVLWQGETGRHEGAMEAQALYLMGVAPEWNSRGAVDRLKLIPDAELKRPRVNVVFTVSGLYRDGLQEKIILLDRAARLAASAGDNPLSRMNREVEKSLTDGGMPADQAKEFAGARVFTTAPGNYGFGLQQFVEQSRDKDEPDTMAQLYLSRMNFVYSEKSWGANVPKLLQNHLRGNESIVHSRSSNLYGAVDNDDVYQWMGGLRVASAAAGAKPELFINNMRKKGEERLEDARSFIATELNARNWNPRWIQEMQKEGYSGAREMMKANEYLYGWQATAPETISPTVWQKMYDVYVADQYNLGMRKFFEQSNPAARQQMVARLLEVDRQGTYQFNPADRQRLVMEYVRLVSKNGAACSANVCGNRRLQQAVLTSAREYAKDPASAKAVRQFEKQFREAFRPQPERQITTSQPKPNQSNLSNLLANIRIVTMQEFAARTRRYVEENAWTLIASLSLTLLCGSLQAAWRRRRPADPPTVLVIDPGN
ncbi:MAG: cobaltochelatase subunit CobN [Acidobacteria bacterium]|nr:cobaltochelatase subunit CobN [Acidobacteriota bacterium]